MAEADKKSPDTETKSTQGKSSAQPYLIERVRTVEDIAIISALFTAYTDWLDIDLAYQDFSAELAGLPGKYAPPTGEILLAKSTTTGESIGCVALRKLNSSKECEMKRLYVSPAGRGTGVGKALVKTILDIAKELGYAEVKLDTLPHMTAAIALYKRIGFVECEKYYDTPIEGTVFLSKIL